MSRFRRPPLISPHAPHPTMDAYSIRHACFSSSAHRLLPSASTPPGPHLAPPPCVEFAIARLLSMVLCFLFFGTVVGCTFGPPYSDDWPDRRRKRAARGGLDSLVLASFPVAPYAAVAGAGAGRVEQDCAVCLTEFEGTDAVRVMPTCGHGFHRGCIDPWLAGRKTCPLCRSDLAAPPEKVSGADHVIVEVAGEG